MMRMGPARDSFRDTPSTKRERPSSGACAARMPALPARRLRAPPPLRIYALAPAGSARGAGGFAMPPAVPPFGAITVYRVVMALEAAFLRLRAGWRAGWRMNAR